jgi:hypothetical protein
VLKKDVTHSLEEKSVILQKIYDACEIEGNPFKPRGSGPGIIKEACG